MNPRWPTFTCVLFRPSISEFGLRPTETRTRSNTFSRSLTSGPSNVTRMPWPSSFTPATVVFSMMESKIFSMRRCKGSTRSRSAPGSSPGSISTTETFDPSAAYTVPSSRPIYPPPTTSKVFGTSLKLSAEVESIMRGVSSLNVGMTAGRDPVAIMIRSNVRVSSPPLDLAIFNVLDFALPGELSQSARQIGDDLLLESAQPGNINLRLAEFDAPLFRVPGFIDKFGNVQERLRRNAPTVKADASRVLFHVNEGDLHAKVGCEECCGITSGAAAYYRDIHIRFISHLSESGSLIVILECPYG